MTPGGPGTTGTDPAPVVASREDGLLAGAADAVLADRAADGDAKAFEVLVRRYGRLLRWYAARVLGTAGSSDDVVQEALIAAWQQLPTLQDRGAVKGWLIRITTRKALDQARGLRHHDDVDALEIAEPAGAGPEGAATATALSESLEAALTALPPGQRQVWVLRELGGSSYDEIAAALDLPVSTVRGLLARARRSLVQQMDGWR